jgi:predicted amidohydrolase YtcJ
MTPDMVLRNGKITTLDKKLPHVSAMAISEGKVLAIGSGDEIMKIAGGATQVIDLKQLRVIPGLNDSHLHIIRGGLTPNPSRDMAAKAPISVTGTVVAGTSVARQFCKNTTMTMRTRIPASNKVL